MAANRCGSSATAGARQVGQSVLRRLRGILLRCRELVSLLSRLYIVDSRVLLPQKLHGLQRSHVARQILLYIENNAAIRRSLHM
jgi:hypothetical protein